MRLTVADNVSGHLQVSEEVTCSAHGTSFMWVFQRCASQLVQALVPAMLLSATGILSPNRFAHYEYLVVSIASKICGLVPWHRQNHHQKPQGCVEAGKKRRQTAP